MISIYRGDFLTETGRHAGRRRRTIAALLTYAAMAIAGAAWIFMHPGRANYRFIGAIPLGATGSVAVLVAVVMIFAAIDKPHLILACVRWVRHAAAFFDYAATLLIATSAASGIGVALYSAHIDGAYDTRVLHVDALGLAYIAASLSIVLSGVITRPAFSLVLGRPRTAAYTLAALSRVLVVGSIFAAAAELAAPGATAWITVGATLLLTGAGWEIARQAGAEGAVREFLKAASALQSAALQPHGDLLSSLTNLEDSTRRRLLGRHTVVETEVVMLVRACIERLQPWESRTYTPKSVADSLQQELIAWDEPRLRQEIGKFATSLRQSVVLRTPLVPGNIWHIQDRSGTSRTRI